MTLIAGHINWTDTDQDLVTTGSGTFASLTVDSLEGIVRADSGLLSANTYVDLPEISEPAAPAANNLRLYVEDIHGFSFFKYLDAGGMKREIVRDSMIIVYNATGSTILANRVVYATGNVGSVPSVALAQSNSAATMPAIGVTIEDIADTAYGRVMQVGLLEDLDTSALTVGDILYVHDTVPGLVRATPPVTPALTQEIGTVLVDDASVGAIQVIARGLTGDEYGTAQNTFFIGDGTAGSKTLTFNAATDASIIWDETKFDLTAAPLTTTGLGTFGSLTVDNVQIDGDDITLTQDAAEIICSGGDMNIRGTGDIRLKPSNDIDDYISFYTAVNECYMTAVGADLHITAGGGEIGFADENLATTGNFSCAAISASSTVDMAGGLSSGEFDLAYYTKVGFRKTGSPNHVGEIFSYTWNAGTNHGLFIDVETAGDKLFLRSASATRVEVDETNGVYIGTGTGVPPSWTNYIDIATNGDINFNGTAGFYPRRITQSAIPASGTGATQIDTGELLMWRDSDDGKVYLVYNDTTSGIKSVELI